MQDWKKITGNVFNGVIVKYATFLIAALVLFYSWQHGRYNGNYINSDGKGYYAYLTAIFIYQDLDYNFIDEYEMKYYAPGSYFNFKREIGDDVANVTFAGVAVLWVPFFLVAHVSSMVMGYPTDGYAPLYQYAIGFAAVFYLFLALWGIKKLLELYSVKKYHIILVQILIVFATPIYFYTTVDASFTHLYSFSMITLFYYYMKRYFMDGRAKHLYMTSLVFGFIVLIRPTNLMVIAALPFLAGSWPVLRDRILDLIRKYVQILLALAIFGMVVSVQPMLYYAQVGEFFIWTYTGVGFNFTDPHILGVLFSYKKGLFLYTPVLIFSLLGFVYLFRKSKYQAITLFTYLFLVIYIISSWWSWWYGMSYGHRAFLDHYIIFALLMGFALKDTQYKIFRYLIYVITPFVIWVNMVQIYQYKNWILYWDMNEEMYWKVFLKTDESYFGLLWREAKTQAQAEEKAILENKFKDLKTNNVYNDSFEGDLIGVKEYFIDHDITHSGNTSIRLTRKNPYSPGLKTEIRALQDTSRVLFKASAWVYVPTPAAMSNFHIVSSIENEHGAYHYQAVYSQVDEIKVGAWNKIEMITEVSEIKSTGDILKVYVWYKGEREVYVDDIKVEFY